MAAFHAFQRISSESLVCSLPRTCRPNDSRSKQTLSENPCSAVQGCCSKKSPDSKLNDMICLAWGVGPSRLNCARWNERGLTISKTALVIFGGTCCSNVVKRVLVDLSHHCSLLPPVLYRILDYTKRIISKDTLPRNFKWSRPHLGNSLVDLRWQTHPTKSQGSTLWALWKMLLSKRRLRVMYNSFGGSWFVIHMRNSGPQSLISTSRVG